MPDNHHQSKPQPGDEELLQEEEQEKVEDLSDQDIEQMKGAVRGSGGSMFFWIDRFQKFKNAYNTLTDPKLAENLLDLSHPENLREVQSAINVSRHELGKKGNQARGYTESRFLFWKSNKLTPDELYRARYSTILAKQLHHRVNLQSHQNKMEWFISNFAAGDQKTAAELKKSLDKWRKNHPGKSLDDAILAESKRIKKARGEGYGRKEEEEIGKKLKDVHQKAIDDHKAETARTADQVKYTLDPNNPSPAASQLRPDLKQAQTGQIATTASTTTPVTPVVPTAPIITPSSPTIAPLIPLATRPPPASPKLTLFSSLSAKWSNFKDKLFSGLRARWSKLTEGISNFFKPLTDRIKNSIGGKLLGKFFGKLSGFDLGGLAKKAIRSLAVKAGLGAATGGIATALDTLKDVVQALTGIDLWNTLGWGVLLLIIGVPFLVILLVMNLGSSANTVPNYGVGNSMKVSLKNPTQRFAWSDFENNFLVIKTKNLQSTNLTWEEFEKNNLRRPLSLLSENK